MLKVVVKGHRLRTAPGWASEGPRPSVEVIKCTLRTMGMAQEGGISEES